MSQDPLFILIIISMAVVLIILMVGIGGFGKGKGENEFEGQDIDAYGLTIIDFPIFSNDFTFSPARLAATKYSISFYDRGIDSDPDRKLSLIHI